MVAKFILPNASFDNVTSATNPRIMLGQTFDVELRGIYGLVRWSADNDEVLDITDDGGFKATIKASNVGKSRVTLTSGRDRLDFVIEVLEEPTVSVGMSFGNIRDRQA